jgi:hypothetical protein
VGASLTALKKSIKDIEDALGRDPANALLQELLVNSSQEEMRVLTTCAIPAARSFDHESVRNPFPVGAVRARCLPLACAANELGGPQGRRRRQGRSVDLQRVGHGRRARLGSQ